MEHAAYMGSRKSVRRTAHDKLDVQNTIEKLKLVDGLATKFNDIFSLARISLPRGAALVNYVTRKAFCW